MKESSIIYKSTFYKPFFGLTIFATLTFGIFSYWVIKLFFIDFSPELSWKMLFPLSILALFVLSLIETLKIKKLIVTKEYLLLHYVFLNLSKRIKWSEISKVELKHSFISDGPVSTASRKYKFHFEGGRLTIYSQIYSNFKGFVKELNKRINILVKSDMKKGFKNERKELLSLERSSERHFKYVMLALLIVLIIIQLLD